MNPLFSGMGGLDPSKMNPQTIALITELMGTLSTEQMMKMQSIMHNSMAGFDVSKEMMEFENSLPSSFREKLAKIMYAANGISVPGVEAPKSMNDARIVILRSVAQGLLSPEEAVKVLFPEQE